MGWKHSLPNTLKEWEATTPKALFIGGKHSLPNTLKERETATPDTIGAVNNRTRTLQRNSKHPHPNMLTGVTCFDCACVAILNS